MLVTIPEKLTRQKLIEEFGVQATKWYLDRIEYRRAQGKIYYYPLKTAYIWMTNDKKNKCGFWKIEFFCKKNKQKNHGRS